jgi:hypothetical protein
LASSRTIFPRFSFASIRSWAARTSESG